jgi:MFS family permease
LRRNACFGGDSRTLGLFTTAIGVGGLAGAAFSGPVRRVSRQGRAMLAAVAVWGAAFAGFAVAPGLWLTLSLLAAAGAADTFTVVFRGAIVAANTPDRLRGRVMATDYVIGTGGAQIGNLEAGALGSLASPQISALAGGLATIAGAVVIGLALPVFTHYRRQPGHHFGQSLPAAASAKAWALASGPGPGRLGQRLATSTPPTVRLPRRTTRNLPCSRSARSGSASSLSTLRLFR